MRKKEIDRLFKKSIIVNGGLPMKEPKTKIKAVEKNLYVDYNGNYVTRFMVNGRVFEKNLTKTSKFDLRVEIAEIKKEAKEGGKGIHLSKDIPTIKKAIELWSEGKKGEVTDRYRLKGVQALEKLLDKISHVKIDDVKTPALKKILNDWFNAPYTVKGQTHYHTNKTFNWNLNLLRSLFTYFVEEEILVVSPAVKLEVKDIVNKQRMQINKSNIKQFFKEADKINSFSLSFQVRAMFYLGLRVAEAANMKWAGWNKEDNTYTPGHSKKTKGNETTSLDIPLPMLEWFKKAEAQEVKNLIYITVNKATNLPYSTTNVDLQFQEISKTFKHKITPHDLRASFITNLSQENDLPTVQAAARHKSINTTMIYVDVNQRRIKKAILGTFNKLA